MIIDKFFVKIIIKTKILQVFNDNIPLFSISF